MPRLVTGLVTAPVTALVTALAVALSLAPPASAAPSAGPDDWSVPRCDPVDSDGSLTYTRDRGATLAATTGQMVPVRYQFTIATLATADHLLSGDEHGRVFASTDAGCSWAQVGTLPAGMEIPQIVAAPDGTAYAWAINSYQLALIDGGTITPLPDVGTGGDSLVELVVDPVDPLRLRAVTQDGRLLESTDGGQRWDQVGTQPPDVYLYDASIDPNDLDHVVLGTLGDSLRTTFDGGATWSTTQLGAPGDRVNAFTVEISPARSRKVYVQALNITESDLGVPSGGRHIYRSSDGGNRFIPVVDQQPGVTLTNGTFLQPHPKRARTLYFVFGSNFGGYGTDLFRYRDRKGGGEFKVEHNSYDDIKAIAFNPKRPKVMMLGLAEEP